MTPLRYYLILFLCATFLALNAAEAYLYHAWEKDLDEQRDHQAKTIYSQRLDAFTEQLLRTTAAEALKDPPLMDLLKQQGIKIVSAGPAVPPPSLAPLESPAPLPATGTAAPTTGDTPALPALNSPTNAPTLTPPGTP